MVLSLKGSEKVRLALRQKQRYAFRTDLHTHTFHSDGMLSPEEMLKQAADGGIHVLAITDHDLPPPLKSGWHSVNDRSVYVVSGVELSGVHEGVELHLLVYFAGELPEEFAAFCRAQARGRALRYEHARMSIGLDIEAADETAFEGRRALTRLHLARALKKAGHAPTISDAFRTWLRPEHGHVKPVTLPFVEAIQCAKAAGGFCSWAHPLSIHLKDWLGVFVDSGLDAIEGIRPNQGKNVRQKYRNIANKKQLYLTGGSDSHGYGNPLGTFAFSGKDMRYWAHRIDLPIDEIAMRRNSH